MVKDGEKVVNELGGTKNDGGKLDWTLLPLDSVSDVVTVLELGKRKYGFENWKNVEKERYVKAAFRHLVAYAMGEEIDPESGKSHMAHLSCCALFTIHLDNKEHK